MSTQKSKGSLKKNKIIDKVWHPESTLVFKSAKEQLAIGRCVNDIFIPLDTETLNLCKEWKFKYDKELVIEEDDEEGEEGDEEEGDEGEEDSENTQEKEVIKEVKEVTKEVTKEVKEVKEVKEEISDPDKINISVKYEDMLTSYFTETNINVNNIFKQLKQVYMKEVDSMKSENNQLKDTLKNVKSELDETKEKLNNIKKALGGV